MKRTTKPRAKKNTPIKGSSGAFHNQQQEPLTITKYTSDLLLSSRWPGDCIAVYHFLYYTAKWQGTYRPKATVGYISKGTGYGRDRVRRVKNELAHLGLIRDVPDQDKKTGQLKGWYIAINILWHEGDKNRTPEFATDGKNKMVDRTPGFADSGENRGKCLYTHSNKYSYTHSPNSASGERPQPKRSALDKDPNKKTFILHSKKLRKIVDSRGKLNPNSSEIQWADHIRLLMRSTLKMNGSNFKEINDRVKVVLSFYEKHVQDKYTPQAWSGEAFRNKFFQLEGAMERSQENKSTEDKNAIPTDVSCNYDENGDWID